MGFNLTRITNRQLSVQEQTSYGLVFVPPRNSNIVLANMGLGHYAQLMDGFKHITSTTQGGYCHFRFRGRRIGILVSKTTGNGMLSFDVDGTWYGQYDTSYNDDYNRGAIIYNIPYIIAVDLPDGEHTLTITKPDNLNTSIQGFLVDDAGHAPTFMQANPNYHVMLDSDSISPAPWNLTTSDTIIRSTNTWLLSATFTNTTASPINVTLKNSTGVVVGPFPIPANDIRQLTGPMYFGGSLKASASTTGIIASFGGQ